MRIGRVIAAVIGLVALFGASAALAATMVVVSWGKAIEVPGTAALNAAGWAVVNSVSCRSPEICSAGGSYRDGNHGDQAFVVDEKKGHWKTAIEVPGTAALNSGGHAVVNSVSCGSAGNCAAGGSYLASYTQAFVVSEKNGVWGTAIEVPGTAALNAAGYASVTSVSCSTAGNCAAAGEYLDGSGKYQAFVADEKNGVWGTAVEVPGTDTLNAGGNAWANSVSCTSATPGNCVAGGFYFDGSFHQQAFVAVEKNGVWGNAIEVPGTAALNAGGAAVVNSVSCAAVGQCSLGGSYVDGAGNYQAFVANDKNGVWGTAIEVPGTGALNTFGMAKVSSVSCASAGNCSAGGSYWDGPAQTEAFVVSEKSGVWGKAIRAPGTTSVPTAINSNVLSVSCATAGYCAAGGVSWGTGGFHAVVLSEKKGVWHKLIEVPGSAALNAGGGGAVNSVSCAKTGRCALGGKYADSQNGLQAFVTSP